MANDEQTVLRLTDNSFDDNGWWVFPEGYPPDARILKAVWIDSGGNSHRWESTNGTPLDIKTIRKRAAFYPDGIQRKEESGFKSANKIVSKVLQVVRQYSGKRLEELLGNPELKRETLTIGVHDQKLTLFTIGRIVNDPKDEDNRKESKPVAFRIDTGNLMGWVALPNPIQSDNRKQSPSIRIEITSRFDGETKRYDATSGKSEDRHFFLSYILARACRVNPLSAIDIDRENEGGMDLILFLLFANYLAKAEPYGVMRAYVKLRKNDLNIKGRIDVSRHVKLNYPVCDRIAYVQRKLTTDIPVNHLIRHAAEAICKRRRGLIESNPLAKSFLEQLRMATPLWRPDSVSDTARTEATRVVIHPYHAEQYEPMRKLALMILRNEGINLYGKDDGETVSGIVFDGSWVWENYLWALLRESGIEDLVHCDNATKKPCIYPFKDEQKLLQWFPDFYINRNDETRAVLDAKYKPLDRRFMDGEWINDDVHEVLSFMYALKAKRGILLYPYSMKEVCPVQDTSENRIANKQSISLKLNGFGGHFGIVGLKIPRLEPNKGYSDFCTQIEQSEVRFIDQIVQFPKLYESTP